MTGAWDGKEKRTSMGIVILLNSVAIILLGIVHIYVFNVLDEHERVMSHVRNELTNDIIRILSIMKKICGLDEEQESR